MYKQLNCYTVELGYGTPSKGIILAFDKVPAYGEKYLAIPGIESNAMDIARPMRVSPADNWDKRYEIVEKGVARMHYALWTDCIAGCIITANESDVNRIEPETTNVLLACVRSFYYVGQNVEVVGGFPLAVNGRLLILADGESVMITAEESLGQTYRRTYTNKAGELFLAYEEILEVAGV